MLQGRVWWCLDLFSLSFGWGAMIESCILWKNEIAPIASMPVPFVLATQLSCREKNHGQKRTPRNGLHR